MKKKNIKGLVVVGMTTLCAILFVGVILTSQSPKGEDTLQNTGTVNTSVTPGGIVTAPTNTPPDIQPGVITPTEPPNSGTGNDISLTVIEDRPAPPELPDTAHHCGEDCEEHRTPPNVTDPALTNPNVKPTATPAPVTPAQPNNNAPQGGSPNSKGEVYVAGFGWIAPSTPQGGQSSSDGDWDKIIGH